MTPSFKYGSKTSDYVKDGAFLNQVIILLLEV